MYIELIVTNHLTNEMVNVKYYCNNLLGTLVGVLSIKLLWLDKLLHSLSDGRGSLDLKKQSNCTVMRITVHKIKQLIHGFRRRKKSLP